MFPRATPEQVASFDRLQRAAVSPEALVAIFQATCRYDVSAELPRVRRPTLVLHSPHDAIVPFAEGRLLAAGIPEARLQTFDSPNHTPLPGEPAWEAAMGTMDEFLAEDVVGA